MRKHLLTIFGLSAFAMATIAQTVVPFANYSFELPEGGKKINTIDELPGWFSDTTYTASGREENLAAPDGNQHGFTSNGDGTVAQVVDIIKDTAVEVTYLLSYYGNLAWSTNTETDRIYTLFSTFSGSDRTTRITADSLAVHAIYGWMRYVHAFTVPANSALAGDSLVLEFNGAGEDNTWIQVDNFNLVKYYGDDYDTTTFEATKIIDGVISNAADYTCILKMMWDADSVYMAFDITDDVIHTGETNVWDGDNIEIYFDMDNSKRAHWPRNGGWVMNDTTNDDNDYQLRIVPGVPWDSINSIGGVKLSHDTIEGGYTFNVNICWDSLLVGFDPSVLPEIGFDILASDNDGDGRNQVTWNCPTMMAYNDPSLWGTVQLLPYGSFEPVYDVLIPGTVSNLKATASNYAVTLSWDAATDNIAIFEYEILQDGAPIDTVYAKYGEQTLKINDLAVGKYTFGIITYDNSGNMSDTAEVDVEVLETSVPRNEVSFNSIYPNPSNGVFNIVTEGNDEVSIMVYNVAGKEVLNDVFTGNYTLNLTGSKSGVYVAHLINRTQIETVKLIVK